MTYATCLGPLTAPMTSALATRCRASRRWRALRGTVRRVSRFWAGSSPPASPGRGSPLRGARAEIDLTRQVLFIISNNQVIKTLAVSTGTTGWRTPPGHFRIQRKIPAWRQSSLGFLYKPAYFNGGIAIHGSYSVPPYAASHGCVRVPVWAMDALYYQLPVGMPVDVLLPLSRVRRRGGLLSPSAALCLPATGGIMSRLCTGA